MRLAEILLDTAAGKPVGQRWFAAISLFLQVPPSSETACSLVLCTTHHAAVTSRQ